MGRTANLWTVILVVALLATSVTPAYGAPPQPTGPVAYPTVQAAIDAAPPGAVVVLHASDNTRDPTPWTESVVIPAGKDGLTLCGGPPDPTQDPGPVVVHADGDPKALCNADFRDEVVIDASGHDGTVLQIDADDITVTGLTLRWTVEAWDLWLDLVGHLDTLHAPVEAVRVEGAGINFTHNTILVKAGPCPPASCSGLSDATGLRLGSEATGAHVASNDITADPLHNPRAWIGGEIGLRGALNDSVVEDNIFSAWRTAAVSLSLHGRDGNAVRNNTFIAGGPLVITDGHGRLDATRNDLRGAQPVALELRSGTSGLYVDAADSDWGTYACDLIHGITPLPGRIQNAGSENAVGVNPFVMPLGAPLATSCPIAELRIDDQVRELEHDADDAEPIPFTATAVDPYGGEVPIDASSDVEWTIEENGGTFEGNVLAPGNQTGEYRVDARLERDSVIGDATDFNVVPGAPAELTQVTVSTLSPSADDPHVDFIFAVFDSHENPVTNATVNVTASAGEVSDLVNHDNGTYGVTLSTTNISGDHYTVNASIPGDYVLVDDIVVVPGAPGDIAARSVSTRNPVATNPTVDIVFEVRDNHTNLVSDAPVTLTLNGPGGSLSVVDNRGNGTYGVTLTTTSTAGDQFAVTGHIPGASVTVDGIVVIPAVPTKIQIVGIDPPIPTADQPFVDVTFEVLDDYDNALAGLNVTATVSGNREGPLDVQNETNGYLVTLNTTKRAGDTFYVTAQLWRASGNLSITTDPIEVAAGPPFLLNITNITTLFPTADNPLVQLTWQVTDNESNPIPDADVTASFLGPAGDALAAPIPDGHGNYTSTVTTSHIAGETFRVVAELNGEAGVLASATSDPITVVPGSPAVVVMDRVSTFSPTADDARVDVTFRVLDQHGNGVPGANLTAAATGAAAALTPITDGGDGAYTTTLTTSRTAGDVFTVVADLWSVGQDTTGDITVTPGAPAVLTVESPTNPTTVDPDDAHVTVTFSVSDAHGNPISGAALVVNVDHAQGILGDIVDQGDGTYVVPLTTTSTPGDRFHVSAQVSGAGGLALTTTAPEIRVAGRSLGFADLPAEVASGVPFTLRVRILDEQGELATTADDQIVLALQARPNGGTLHGPRTVQATNGIATFTGLTLDRTGAYTLGANAVDLNVSATGQLVVVPGPPARIVFDSVPQQALTGQAFAVSIRLRDGHGNQVNTADQQVTLSVFHGPGAFNRTQRAQTGLMTFEDVRLGSPGHHNLRASAPGLQSATSATIDIRAPPPSSLKVLESQANAESGAPFTVRIEVVDPNGTRVTEGTHPITLSRTTGPGGNLRGERTQSSHGGLAVFGNLTLDVAGNYTLSARSTGLGSTSTPPIAVRPGPPAHLLFTSIPSHVPLDHAFDVRLRVVDANGNTVTNLSDADTITLSVSSGPQDGLQGDTQQTGAGGTGHLSNLRFNPTGTYRLNATLDWQSGGGSLVRSTSPEITVGPGAPVALTFAAVPSRVTSGAAFSTTVHILDAEGNLAVDARDPVTLAHATGPADGRLSGTRTAQPVGGVATFTGLQLDRAGLYSLRAAIPGITHQSNGIMVEAGAPQRLVFDTVADAVAAFSTTLRVEDAHGNRVRTTTPQVTLSIATGPTSAALSGTTARPATAGLAAFPDVQVSAPGSYRFLAQSPGIQSALSPLIQINGPGAEDVAVLDLTPSTNLTVAAGEIVTFSVRGTNANGVAVDAPLAVSYVLSNPKIGHIDATGTFRGVRTGAVELHARLGDVVSDPVMIIVTPGELARLRVSPESTSVPRDAPVTFIAEGTDAFGNRVAVTNVTWSTTGVPAVNLSGDAPFHFASNESDSRHRVQATSGNITGAGTVVVTSLHVPTGSEVRLNATSTHTWHLNASRSTHTAGVASAAAGARLSVGSGQSNGTGVSAFEVLIGSDAYRLGLGVESGTGDLSAPPEGLDLGDLITYLAGTATAPTPALFFRVAASEGGQDVTSLRLNELLGSVNATFWLPETYFTDNGLDRDRVRLIEYSDGVRRNIEIVANRTSTEAVNGSLEYRVHLEAFSTFAVIALQASAAVPPVEDDGEEDEGTGNTGNTGGGGGGRWFPVTDHHDVVFRNDPVLAGVRLDLEDAAALPGLRIRSLVEAPSDTPPLPPGLHIAGYVDVELGTSDASPTAITFRLSLAADQVEDPDRGHLMRLVDGVWVREGRIVLAEESERLVGNATGRCCSLFAIVFDGDRPAVALTPPATPLVGTVGLVATASDNLGVARVEFRFGGHNVGSLDEAPYTIELDTAAYENGLHVLEIIATDVSGWTTTATYDMEVQNAAGAETAATDPAGTTRPDATWPAVILILGALLVAVGATAYLRRGVRRPNE